MGEATSDYMVKVLDPVLAVGIGFVALVLALLIQFRVRRFLAAVYWLAAVAVSVFGTMAADVLHVGLGVPYVMSAAGFSFVLVLIFVIWYRVEHTLSIHSIYTRRREIFYWSTVMATFALGTATGDLAASSLHLGYLRAAICFAIAFAVPALFWLTTRRHAVALFWAAYILTRPVGASMADWLGKAPVSGGLGIGDGTVAAVLSAVIFILVLGVSLVGGDAQTQTMSDQA